MMGHVAKQRSARDRLDRRLLLVMPAFMLVILMAGLDQTAVAVSLPSIVGALGGLAQMSWVVIAYGIAIGVSTPIHGKLADLYNRKRLFQGGLVVFLAGSVLCGIAQSVMELISFRALQGIGAGGLVVYSQAILAQLIAPAERGRYVGFTQSAFVASTVAGPVVGGVITQDPGWRYIFYVNVPVCLIALLVVGTRLSLPAIRCHRMSFNWWGVVMFIGAVSSVFMLIELAGGSYSWTAPTVIGFAVAAVVMVLLYVWSEYRATDPLLPVRQFGNPVFRVVIAVVFMVGFATAAVTLFMPLYLQVVLGYPPARAGLLLAPLWLTSGVTATVCGQVLARVGRYRSYPVIGTFLLAVGLAVPAVLGRAPGSYYPAMAGIILIGAGLGMINSVMMIVAQNVVRDDEVGRATSATTFSQTIGASFGAATLGMVFAAAITVPGHDGVANLGGHDETWQRLAGLPEGVRSSLVGNFADALGLVFFVGAGVALAGFLLTLLLKQVPLRRHVGSRSIERVRDGSGGHRS